MAAWWASSCTCAGEVSAWCGSGRGQEPGCEMGPQQLLAWVVGYVWRRVIRAYHCCERVELLGPRVMGLGGGALNRNRRERLASDGVSVDSRCCGERF